MNTESEITELKQEVARLRREMDELRQFIRYQPPGVGDDDRPQSAYLSIRCTFLSLFHPSRPDLSPINMMAGPDGAFVSVSAQDEKTRVVMNVDKDVPSLTLFDKNNKCAVDLRLVKDGPQLNLFNQTEQLGAQVCVSQETARGQVGVLEAGKPRAVLKATDGGGAISVVHDDGHPRMTMGSTEDSGCLLAISQDLKVGVKLSANGPHGGYLTVNHLNGKAGVMLVTTPLGGGIILNDSQGNRVATFPTLE